MARLTPEAARALYKRSHDVELVEYNPQLHDEAMQDLVPGLVGASLSLGLPSLCGPEIGSSLPVAVLNIPKGMPQIFVAPVIKKEPQGYTLAALSYQGDLVKVRSWSPACHFNDEMWQEAFRFMHKLGFPDYSSSKQTASASPAQDHTAEPVQYNLFED